MKGSFNKHKQDILFIAAFFILCLSFLSYLFYNGNRDRIENLGYSFYGPVKYVTYDVKGTPYVTIDTNRYYLSAGYNFDHKIEKGDTIKKVKGSNIYILTKQNTGKVYEFSN
jgi:hypothetical protein